MRIISGGQTGPDAAALRFGLVHGVEIGGTVPRGFCREGGRIPPVYRTYLVEARSPSYASRTLANVRGSDRTLVINRGELSGGTRLTTELCRRERRECLVVEAEAESSACAIRQWLGESYWEMTVNIAGPRESKRPGITLAAYALLVRALAPLVEAARAGTEALRARALERVEESARRAREDEPAARHETVGAWERAATLALAGAGDAALRRVVLAEDERVAEAVASLGEGAPALVRVTTATRHPSWSQRALF